MCQRGVLPTGDGERQHSSPSERQRATQPVSGGFRDARSPALVAMEGRTAMRMWLLRALLLALVGGIGWGGFAMPGATAVSRPANYRAAVIRALNDRGVGHRDVIVTDGCAPTYQQCHTYAGAVRVLAEVEHTGRIACRERWTSCTLRIAELRVADVSLADTRNPLAWRWQQRYYHAARWLQALWAPRVPEAPALLCSEPQTRWPETVPAAHRREHEVRLCAGGMLPPDERHEHPARVRRGAGA
jgi:hypothetical protein